MSLLNPKTVVTEERLNEYHQAILPYLGGMPDILANKFSKGDMYSTDEKMIGQWIDSKPLYQRVFIVDIANEITVAPSTAEDLSYAHGISNIDFMKYSAFSQNKSNKSAVSLMYSQNKGNQYKVSVSTTNVGVTFSNLSSSENFVVTTRYIYVVIQYTKTTDSAVSIGDDTDYSTTEKIVGTWITGEPIYQKTITFSNITFNSANQYYYSLTGLDIDKAWVVNGFHYGGDYVQRPLDVLGQYKVTTWGIQNSSSPVPNSFYLQSSDGTAINRTFYITIQYTKVTS